MIYGFYWTIPPVPLKGQRIRPRPTQRQVVGDFGSTAETAAAAATALKAEVDSKAFAFTSKLASIEAALGAETWRTVADIAFRGVLCPTIWGFFIDTHGHVGVVALLSGGFRDGSGFVRQSPPFFGPTQVADSTFLFSPGTLLWRAHR